MNKINSESNPANDCEYLHREDLFNKGKFTQEGEMNNTSKSKYKQYFVESDNHRMPCLRKFEVIHKDRGKESNIYQHERKDEKCIACGIAFDKEIIDSSDYRRIFLQNCIFPHHFELLWHSHS